MSVLTSILNLTNQLIPTEFRQSKHQSVQDFIHASVAPLQDLLDEQLDLEHDSKYKAAIQFGTIYIETFLNDLLDDALRRIYIETNEGAPQVWNFQRIEQRASSVSFKRWKASVAYSTGDTVLYKGIVYTAAQNSTGQAPLNNVAFWTYVGASSKVFQRIEFTPEFSFTVYLPDTFNAATTYNKGEMMFTSDTVYVAKQNGVTGSFDSSKWSVFNNYLRTELKRYVPAGNNYNIKTY